MDPFAGCQLWFALMVTLSSFGARTIFQLVGSERWQARLSDSGIFGPDQILTFNLTWDLKSLGSKGTMRISFRKSPEAFRSISAVDILNGNFEEDVLDNVLVLVGATAFGLDDIVPTPYSGYSPGVELQARLLSSILDEEVPFAPSGKALIGFMISSLLAVMSLFLAVRRGRYAMLGLPVMVVGAPFLALGIHGFALINYSLWIGWIGTALFGSLVSSILLIVEHARCV